METKNNDKGELIYRTAWLTRLKQTKNCLFMAGSQHFSPGDNQFQLVYDRGQCGDSSYLNALLKQSLLQLNVF